MSEHDIILCFVEWLVQFDYLTTNKSFNLGALKTFKEKYNAK